jgi:hypothetical protein
MRIIEKLKNYFFQPISVEGEEFVVGLKTIKPSEVSSIRQNSMRHGDRKRYFTNYNAELVNRISEIKSKNS